jgi:hypothetical protein
MKKIRIQSPLDTLPLHQKQALMGWLTTGGVHEVGISYKDARARLKTEFGVQASETALCHFFRRHRASGEPQVQTAFDAKTDVLTISIHVHLHPCSR